MGTNVGSVIGMITLDIILWVGVQSFKMTFPVQNDQGGWGHQHGKKVPKSHSFFLSGCGSPNNFLMSKENTALVVLLAQRQVKAALRVNYHKLQHKFVF